MTFPRKPARRHPLRVACLTLFAALGACAQETGDFGRPEPGLLHDTLLPQAGSLIADQVRGDQVSDYNVTDREKLMRDRAWGLVAPPHLNDWFGEALVEGQRTRILPEVDSAFNARAYYELLRRDPFVSSETRWGRLIKDMTIDAQLIDPFWRAVRAVNADDVQRVRNMDQRTDLTPGELHAVYARIDENARVADWVWRSMRFRLKSYRICIDRMLLETPTDRQWEVNQAYEMLEKAITLAEQNTKALTINPDQISGRDTRRSRYTSMSEVNTPVPIK